MLLLTPPGFRPTEPLPSPSAPRLRWSLSTETLVLLAALWFSVISNSAFRQAALQGLESSATSPVGFGIAALVGVAALHALLVGLVATRWTVRPLLAVLLLAAAFATHYMDRYGVYLDPTMLRNVLRTDWHEARELLSPSLLLHLAWQAALPLLLLWRVQPAPWPGLRRGVLRRAALVGASLVVLVATVMSVFQPFASLMRNNKEMRYLITPANALWSLAVVAGADARAQQRPRQPIGLDATPGPLASAPPRPQLVVVVVGETARAANWGLTGYARDTTPQLRGLPVISWPHATACGTNTETSLPCMFAPVGRRDYDEARIRGSESLLHVAARAGVGVTWRDNQSGCKGVCEGLPTQLVRDMAPAALCSEGRCLDEGLLHGLPEMLRSVRGTQLLVLHQLGNHGPSYFRRYPPAFAHFKPECRHDDLHRCTREEVVNAYDNALRYTDHVLAQLLQALQAASGTVDSAVIYVSDHGESLGEANLYLHGLPYAIAPDVQKQVPMFMWLSDGFAQVRGLDLACLRDRARQPAAHDHLFHTLLGLLDVRTSLLAPEWDLTRPCRRNGAPS